MAFIPALFEGGVVLSELGEVLGIGVEAAEVAEVAAEPLLVTEEVAASTSAVEATESSSLLSQVKPYQIAGGAAAADVGRHLISGESFQGSVKNTTRDLGSLIGSTASGVLDGATESLFENPYVMAAGALVLLYLFKK